MSVCTPLSASDNQQKLDALRQSIQAAQEQLTTQEKIKRDAADELLETERAIRTLNGKLTTLQQQLQTIEAELDQLATTYHHALSDLKSQQGQLNALLYQQYTRKPPNYFHALLNQQDPNQTLRQQYYYRQLSLARSDGIAALQHQINELKTLAQKVRIKKTALAQIEHEYSAQSRQLAQEKLTHKTMIDDASQTITHHQDEIDRLSQDEKRVTRLIAAISAVLKQADDKAIYNTRLPAPTDHATPFTSLKGQLSLPVRGELINRFGARRSGKLTWKGLFIRAAGNSDVKAIAHGRVVFADWLRGFGNLVIVEHAQNYMSLYGNNAILLKQVGDTVTAGDTIATVGSGDGNTDSGVYFELRYQGKAFDPLSWIRIE